MNLTYERKGDVLYGFFPEIVTSNILKNLHGELDGIEKLDATIHNRVVDLSAVKSFEADFDAIYNLAQARNRKVFPNRFKTALLVSNKYQLGFARMYQTFINNPSMQVEIFSDESKALDWLNTSENTAGPGGTSEH